MRSLNNHRSSKGIFFFLIAHLLFTQFAFSQVCTTPNIGTTSVSEPLSIPIGQGKKDVYLDTTAIPTFREMLGINVAIYQLENNKLASYTGTNLQGQSKSALDIFSQFRVFYPQHRDYWQYGDELQAPFSAESQVPKNNVNRLALVTDNAGLPLLASGQPGKYVFPNVNSVTGKIEIITENLKAPGAYYNVYQNYMNNNWIKMYGSFNTLKNSNLPINKKFSVALEVIPANFTNGSAYQFPNNWFLENDWGTTYDERKLNAKIYAMMFARTYSPKVADCATCPSMVETLELGNEPWGYSHPNVYKAIVEGFMEGLKDYYASDTTNRIKILPASFQAHHPSSAGTANVFDLGTWKDYMNEQIPASAKCDLEGVNLHLYSNTFNGNNLTLNVSYPERVTQTGTTTTAASRFYMVRNAWKWLKDNPFAKKNIYITEWGWDSDGCTPDMAVGMKTQAIYTIRNLLMMGRYGVKKANLYQLEDDPNVGCGFAYFSSGVWSTQKTPKYIFKALENFIQKAGTTKFHYALREDPNDVFAYILEQQDQPKYMVAWLARDINYTNDTKTLSQVIASGGADCADGIGALKSINLSFNGRTFRPDTNQAWYRLDGETASPLNLATFYVNGQYKLSPVPILIPILDDCGNDTQAPVFANCPANIEKSTSSTSAVATWTAPTATDNCTATPSVTSTHNSGATFPVGTTTVTYTARDAKNNSATCSFTITVTNPCTTDTVKPILANCPTNISQTTTGTTAIVNWAAPTATDNCGTPTLTSTHNAGAAFPIGTTTVRYTATDAKNNTATCSFTVTVATQPANYCASKSLEPWQEWVAGVQFYTINNLVQANEGKVKDWSSTGYSNFTNLQTTVQRGQIYPLSIKSGVSWAGLLPTLYCRAWIDYNGNFVFEDNEKVFEGTNQAVFNANIVIPPTVVAGVTRMRVSIKFGGYPTACEAIQRGEVEDYSVNIETDGTDCVNDKQAPTIVNCPRDTSVTTANLTANVNWTPPTAFDNCIPPTLTSSHAPNSAFPVGETIVTYTAMDSRTNIRTCEFKVTVVSSNACLTDTVKPVFANCPLNITLTTADTAAIATWTAPTATDNCTTPPSVSSTHNTGATFKLGTTTVIYTATDAKNNRATCSFTITVGNPCANDTVKPVLANCPTNISLTATSGSTAVATWTAPSATDNCTAVPTITISHNSGAAFSIGTTTVTYTARDAKNNTATCAFTVTVAPLNANYCTSKSTEPWQEWVSGVRFGTISNTVQANEGKVSDWGSIGYSNFTNLKTDVNRGQTYPLSITPVVSWAGLLPSTYCRVWIDFNGNRAFEDNEKVLEGQGVNLFTSTVTIPAMAVSGNTRMRVSLKSGAYPTACESFTRGEVEDYTVNIGGSDCTSDAEPPVWANCPTNIALTTADTAAIATWIVPTATDNCTTPPSVTSTHNSGATFKLGTTTVIYTARDAKNNSATCSFTVTVTNPCLNDVVAPVFANCPANIALTATGQNTAATWAAPTATDNCTATPTLTSTHNSGATFPVGTTTVIYTARDAKNNSTTCSFTVTISPQNVNYCVSKAIEPWQEWIGGVQFGNLNNTTQANEGKSRDWSTLGYTDFTDLQATVNKGQTTPLSITPRLSWAGRLPDLYCRVWIDFNGNRTFEDNELVLNGRATNPFIANVSIPANTPSGTVRMRVSLKQGGAPTACENFTQGEVEDYTVVIR
jgi:lipoprotein signal peptidase